MIAVLIADGVKAEPVAMACSALTGAGADPRLVGARRGTVRSNDGQEFTADATLAAIIHERLDGLVLPDGDEAVTRLLRDEHSLELIRSQCGRGHPIFVGAAAVRMLDAAGITASSHAPDRGVVIGWVANLQDGIDDFVSAVRASSTQGHSHGRLHAE